MIHVYICDEDQTMIASIKRILQKIANDYKLDICIKGFDIGIKMLSTFSRDSGVVDLVCLNTMVNTESGIQIGKKLRSEGYTGDIVFFSEDEKEVLNSFEVRARAYLVKGKDEYAKFKDIFLKLVKRTIWQPDECMLCSKSGTVKRIPIKDIRYIEIQGRISKVFYRSESIEIGVGLNKLEEQLSDKDFIRINRSSLVNINFIKERRDKSIKLLSGEEVLIGRKYIEDVDKKLSDSFWEACYLVCS